jgi:alpha-tubulin suppressor-like RCC1 family protein
VGADPNPLLVDSYNRYSSVTVGNLHACTLDAEGGLREVACFGNNQLGQLGVDPALFPTSSVLLGSSLGKYASRVTTQTDFTCADQTNGFVQCVGANGVGQLGNAMFASGPTFQSQAVGSIPYVVGSEMHLSGVSTGTDHACALNPAGSAYCWGNGNWGQVGNGAIGNFNRPQAVSGGLTFRKIAAGNSHTCGITTDNHIFCWGNNAYGQLGVGYVPDQNSSDPYRWTSTPIQAMDPK